MSERKKTNYMKQSGIRGSVSWLLLALFVVKMIYMSYQTGMNAVAFYAFADAVFVTGYVLLGLSVIPVLKKMVCFQINHGNYKNTAKVYRVIEGLLMVIAAVLALSLFFFSEPISAGLFQTKLCSLLFKLMAVALFFWILLSGLKGYMEGIGNAMPGIFADVLAYATGLVVTVVSQSAFSEYGRKVAALMRQDSYAYAYAACSGALGLAVGGCAGFLFLLVIRSVFGKEIRRRARSEEMRKTDSVQDIVWNFLGNYLKNTFTENMGVLLAVVLFVLYAHFNGNAEGGAGMLFLGMVVLGLPIALLSSQISAPFARQLTSIMKQADFHHAKERMSFYLKLLSYTVLPLAAVGFALAPLLAETLFDFEHEKLASVIRIGMLSGALVAYGIFLRKVLSVIVKPYLRNVCAGLLGVAGILFLYVLKGGGMTGEKCAAYAYVLACLVYFLVAAFWVLKKIRIYNRLIDGFLVPFVSAALAAAVVFGIFVLLDGKMAAWLLLLICVGLAYIIYHLMIVFLHIFEAHEWKEVPAADFPVMLAKLIGKY